LVEKQKMIPMAPSRSLCYGDFARIPYYGG